MIKRINIKKISLYVAMFMSVNAIFTDASLQKIYADEVTNYKQSRDF